MSLEQKEPCCTPSKANQQNFKISLASAPKPRIRKGSLEGFVRLDGGPFWMGSESGSRHSADGEAPIRKVTLPGFAICTHAVTNEEFARFVRRTGYQTEAERFSWSFVFRNFVREPQRWAAAPITPWWLRVSGADWAHPEGPGTSIAGREHHPVVHISWNDAMKYSAWAGYRLPTEAEWEYAARGGLEQKTFPWGDDLTPGGRHMCNIWQGNFPDTDLGDDGYKSTAPVNCFEPNRYGLFAIVGNAWEWCFDWFDASWHVQAARFDPAGPAQGAARIMRGGSYLCHESYCQRYRNAARTGTPPDTGTGHIGFRVVRDL